MKKNLCILILLLLLYIPLKSQTIPDKFLELISAVHKIKPDLDFTNKLVFISMWKSTDFESREINKEAFRVYKGLIASI